ncbi:MAG: hypothetical protein ISS82_04695 [Nanoarchaeota archaeon]|nr:hypothetical protein [Nanoarchaeota archaeon]
MSLRLKAEDIAFLILVLAAVFVLLWLLVGSPTLESSVITVGLFIISSEFMLWKKYFDVDKKSAIGFVKVKSDFDEVKNRLGGIDNKLNNIEKLLKGKRL